MKNARRLVVLLLLSGWLSPQAFGQYLYWASDGAINRAPLGGGATEVVVSGLSDPRGVALDPVAGKVYWAEFGANRIGRANLDGSSAETFVATTNPPLLVTVDPYERRLFWSESDDLSLDATFVINLDGTAQQEIPLLAKPIHTALVFHHASGEIYLGYCDELDYHTCHLRRTAGGAAAPNATPVALVKVKGFGSVSQMRRVNATLTAV